jgi:hypothetical protein
MRRQVTDREFYPAVWITMAVLLILWAIWRYLLGRPAIAGCWIYRNLHIYCPGCGGTRALYALFRGQIVTSFYEHPAVPLCAATVAVYLTSQTVWRLRGRVGWRLQYSDRWPRWLLILLLVNCAVRNILLLCFQIPIP